MDDSRYAQDEFERRGFILNRSLFAREEMWAVDDALRHARDPDIALTLSRHRRLALTLERLGGRSVSLAAYAIDANPAQHDDSGHQLIVAVFLGDLDPCERALLVAPGSHRVARPRTLDNLETYLDWMASGRELEMLSGPAGSAAFLHPRLFYMVSRSPGARARTMLFLSYGAATGGGASQDGAILWPPAHAWTAG